MVRGSSTSSASEGARTPNTWEEAAAEAAWQVSDMVGHGDDRCEINGEELHSIEVALQNLRDDQFTESWLWAHIGCEAMVASNGDIAKVVETIISKQHDYGHENILWAGRDGLIVRMHDKVARIKNLQKRQAELQRAVDADPCRSAATAPALNESLADSWLDIVGYSIIGIMLEQGTFELPLAADVDAPSWAFGDDGEPLLPPKEFQPQPSPLFDADEEARIVEVIRDNLALSFSLNEDDERQIKGWIADAIRDHETRRYHGYQYYVQPYNPYTPYQWPKVNY